jgi:hypothetical protein
MQVDEMRDVYRAWERVFIFLYLNCHIIFTSIKMNGSVFFCHNFLLVSHVRVFLMPFNFQFGIIASVLVQCCIHTIYFVIITGKW